MDEGVGGPPSCAAMTVPEDGGSEGWASRTLTSATQFVSERLPSRSLRRSHCPEYSVLDGRDDGSPATIAHSACVTSDVEDDGIEGGDDSLLPSVARQRCSIFGIIGVMAAVAGWVGGDALQRPAAAMATPRASPRPLLRNPKEGAAVTSSLMLLGDSSEHTHAGRNNSDDHDEPFCGSMERDVEFVGIPEIQVLQAVPGAGACCTLCQADPRCRAWVWGPQDRDVLDGPNSLGTSGPCSLRQLNPDTGLTKVPSAGIFSGQPFRRARGDSLLCFVLTQPSGYELDLLALQHKERTGIFACDEFVVYSNKVLKVAPGVVTSVVDSNLECESGGEFRTALNTDIFLAVWAKAISDGRFHYNDWTIKADPDTVFFADRLRIVVHFHQEEANEPRGAYLNNCKYGMHGPLEVFSRRAIYTWAAGAQRCVDHFTKLCSGPCLWGEDMFIDQCLEKVLMVKRVDDWNLLDEDHCDSKEWHRCESGAVAFHPFKNADDFQDCMDRAKSGVLQP